jgi:hypothetical protein
MCGGLRAGLTWEPLMTQLLLVMVASQHTGAVKLEFLQAVQHLAIQYRQYNIWQ